MDYHFYRTKVPKKAPLIENKKLLELLKKFIPVFVLSAALPLFIFIAIRPEQVNITSRADQQLEFRVWFEPSNILLNKGSEVEVKVIASFNGENKLVPGVEMGLNPSANISVDPDKLSNLEPFSGQKVIGEIRIKGVSEGVGNLTIPNESIVFVGMNDQVKITVGEATINVR